MDLRSISVRSVTITQVKTNRAIGRFEIFQGELGLRYPE